MTTNHYTLPPLKFDYDALWPYITEEQLRTHHERHHQGYVNRANSLLIQLDEARKTDQEVNLKSLSKSLSFNIGGHVLHSLFWENLHPSEKDVEIPMELKNEIESHFGSVKSFKHEFEQVANSVEGSGWAALVYSPETRGLLTMQIEKHNTNLFPDFKILMVIDVWEHAYYLDYRHERKKFVRNFWGIVDWETVAKRLSTNRKNKQN